MLRMLKVIPRIAIIAIQVWKIVQEFTSQR